MNSTTRSLSTQMRGWRGERAGPLQQKLQLEADGTLGSLLRCFPELSGVFVQLG